MSDDKIDGDDEEPEASAIFPSRGPGPDDMVGEYLPGEEEWLAKTHLDLNDPAAVSALLNLEHMFPEVGDLQPLVNNFLQDFFKSKTSVGGMSRSEYRKILMGMYGASDNDDGSNALKLVHDPDDE